MFGDLFSTLTNGSPNLEAEELQLDQINIAFKKIELKLVKVTTLNAAYSQTLTNLLVKKNIITNEEFTDELNTVLDKENKSSKALDELEKQLKDMEEKYNKKLEEFNKKNEVYLDFLKTIYPDLYKEKFGDNEKEKKEDKDGE